MQIPPVSGYVGLFWIIEEKGDAILLSHAVPLEQAAPYGDMLTVETSHQEYWSQQARRGAHALRAERLPTAPTWSEYEEWPRGRVIYDCANRRFNIRADRQLHRPAFIDMIAERFEIDAKTAAVLEDDHYRSVRKLPLNNTWL
jgi:hypothetical protein